MLSSIRFMDSKDIDIVKINHQVREIHTFDRFFKRLIEGSTGRCVGATVNIGNYYEGSQRKSLCAQIESLSLVIVSMQQATSKKHSTTK